MVGPLSSVGNSQLLADRSQIAQTLGWLGLVHLQLGDMANGKARLKQVIDQYQDQIDDVLRAYATLVRAARAANNEKAVAKYIEEYSIMPRGFCSAGKTQVIQRCPCAWRKFCGWAGNPRRRTLGTRQGKAADPLSHERRTALVPIGVRNCLVDRLVRALN